MKKKKNKKTKKKRRRRRRKKKKRRRGKKKKKRRRRRRRKKKKKRRRRRRRRRRSRRRRRRRRRRLPYHTPPVHHICTPTISLTVFHNSMVQRKDIRHECWESRGSIPCRFIAMAYRLVFHWLPCRMTGFVGPLLGLVGLVSVYFD